MSKSEGVDYRRRVSMVVKDTLRSGRIVFSIDVYGLSLSDTRAMFPEASEPFLRAVERMGLDPDRYHAEWDPG